MRCKPFWREWVNGPLYFQTVDIHPYFSRYVFAWTVNRYVEPSGIPYSAKTQTFSVVHLNCRSGLFSSHIWESQNLVPVRYILSWYKVSSPSWNIRVTPNHLYPVDSYRRSPVRRSRRVVFDPSQYGWLCQSDWLVVRHIPPSHRPWLVLIPVSSVNSTDLSTRVGGVVEDTNVSMEEGVVRGQRGNVGRLPSPFSHSNHVPT